MAFWQASDGINQRACRPWHGRLTDIPRRRYLNDVLLRGGRGAWSGNWLERTVGNGTTGEQRYHHSVITPHARTNDSIPQRAQAGRGRWQSDNDNTPGRKTKGYHIAHNFGHGKHSLSAFMLRRTLRAFLAHTVLGGGDGHEALWRQPLVSRQTFFDDMRALTRYMGFERWYHGMEFMSTGLELKPTLDTG